MSRENVKKFLSFVRTDEVLAGKVLELRNGLQMKESLESEKEILEREVLPLAREYGCDFTVEEFLSYSNSVAESLRESDLLSVSGGVSARAVGLGLLFATGLGFAPGVATNFASAMVDVNQRNNNAGGGGMVKFAGAGWTWDATLENLFNSAFAVNFDLDKLTNAPDWKKEFKNLFAHMELCEDGTLQVPRGLGTACGTNSQDYKHKGMLRTLVIFAAAGRERLSGWQKPSADGWGPKHVTLGPSLRSWFERAKLPSSPVVFAFDLGRAPGPAPTPIDRRGFDAAGSGGASSVKYISGNRDLSLTEFVKHILDALYAVEFEVSRLDEASKRRLVLDIEYSCWAFNEEGKAPHSREFAILNFLTTFKQAEFRMSYDAFKALRLVDPDAARSVFSIGPKHRMGDSGF